MARHRTLIILLRVAGVLGCTAVFAVFMPTAWMAATHEWLGLGEFPDAPITQYLTRSLSAFYAVFGGLAIVVSTDVRRHVLVIAYLACATIAFGVLLIAIDALAGLPTSWTLFEGPPTVAIGVVILLLVRRMKQPET